eukprot:TRINITY_DN3819_c0_g1_i1.p1 TRINITY_DN3819_c0_g1~~TRINITY_DN3819_c0_g1_i1.p1  ORF type:complete len:432 (+),score=47.09 TRINITY_DN3819_c0_g1_i1:22-1317(+)
MKQMAAFRRNRVRRVAPSPVFSGMSVEDLTTSDGCDWGDVLTASPSTQHPATFASVTSHASHKDNDKDKLPPIGEKSMSLDKPKAPWATRPLSTSRNFACSDLLETVHLKPSSPLRLHSESLRQCRISHLDGTPTKVFDLGDVILGTGAFSTVYLAVERFTGDRAALKQLPWGSTVSQEAALLKSLSHPNIVQFYGIAYDGPFQPYLTFEYVSGGSLLRSISQSVPLPLPLTLQYGTDVLRGLAYLHSKGVVHGDVKPANILIDERTDTAKLADFGLSSVTTSFVSAVGLPQWSHSHHHSAAHEEGNAAGTLWYMAPEQFTDMLPPSRASDVWSYAVTLLEAATGKRPWHEYGTARELLSGFTADQCPSIPATLPGDLKTLLLDCLQHNVQNRPRSAHVLRHTFFSEQGFHSISVSLVSTSTNSAPGSPQL